MKLPLFSLLTKIPFFGDALRILNIYAHNGDPDSSDSFAGFWNWLKAFGLEFLLSVVLALLAMPKLANDTFAWFGLSWRLCYTVDVTAHELSTGVLPNVLGFGIGVYALVFAINSSLLRKIQSSYKGKQGSVLLLNADMALPLLSMFFAILIGVLHKTFPGVKALEVMSWFALWWSMIYTLELIYTLFDLGENSIIDAISEDGR